MELLEQQTEPELNYDESLIKFVIQLLLRKNILKFKYFFNKTISHNKMIK